MAVLEAGRVQAGQLQSPEVLPVRRRLAALCLLSAVRLEAATQPEVQQMSPAAQEPAQVRVARST